MGDSQKKIVVGGIASILLVAAVVAVAIGSTKRGGENANTNESATRSKAVQSICSPTDFKETCEESLAQANTTDTKELVKLALDATVKNMGDVLKNSPLLKEAAADPNTKDAYAVCQEVLDNAVADLKRSVEAVGEFDVARANEYAEDLKTWLSAVIIEQETCVDAFNETNGKTGEKMRALLKTVRQMTSNGLAMVTDLSSVVASLQLGVSRKLLSVEPAFAKRRLLEAERISLEPTIVVAKDGSGNFKTINEAVASLPAVNNASIVIYVKEGVYEENVVFPKDINNITLIGDGPLKTRITGNKCFADGIKTYNTATVAVNGDDFMAKDIGFENTAGPEGHQAVALRASGDRAVFFNVAIDGHQDTLFAHMYRQYYRDCTISGTIDIVFGDAFALFQNCKFIVRKPAADQDCVVTAEGRVDPRSTGAFVIQNGTITAEEAFLSAKPAHKAFLGRPWKLLSRTIIMQSNIEGFIDPAGWTEWMGSYALDTLYYGEYQNLGPGSDTANRVQWKGIQKITPEIAESWTGGVAYNGDAWIKESGVPYVPTLMQV